MSRTLITTVGTSLITNRDARPWAGWLRGQPLPEADSVDRWLAEPNPERPVKASAESNTLHALRVGEFDQVVLFHSDTPEGRFCSARLKHYYEKVVGCPRVTEKEISALGYNSQSFSQKGLKSLVALAIDHINAARPQRTPVFCATGGFKAEIAFLNLLGALLDVEVYYIHDQHREIVRLPRLPLAWDTEAVTRHADFFEWIEAEPRTSQEVEGWLNGRPDLRPLVQDDPDGHTYLSAAGLLVFKAAQERSAMGPRVRWPDAVARPPQEKSQVSEEEHHRPRGWKPLVNRLCEIDCVRMVRYDSAAHGGAAVRVSQDERGVLFVRYEDGKYSLPLRVETTATSDEQSELVAEYIRQKF